MNMRRTNEQTTSVLPPASHAHSSQVVDMLSQSAIGFETPSKAREAYRKSNLKAIERMLRHLKPPQHRQTDHIAAHTYSRLPISITRLPSDCHDIDFETRFSKPMDKAKFDTIFAELFGAEGERFHLRKFYSKECQGFSWMNTMHKAIHCGDYDSRTLESSPNLLDFYPWQSPDEPYFGSTGEAIYEKSRHSNWGAEDVLVVTRDRLKRGQRFQDQRPHVACFLENTASMDEGLPRGDLITILTMMKQRLRRKRWNSHAIIPVFVYHGNDHEARVTQAHFDGEMLHIRQTDPFVLDDRHLMNLKALLKWIITEPIGDTLFRGTGEPERINPDQAPKPPPTPKKTAISLYPDRDWPGARESREAVIHVR